VKNHFVELPVVTGEGEFRARYSEKGLAGLSFPERRRPNGRKDISAAWGTAAGHGQLNRWHRLTQAALNRVLAGRAPGRLPPLDWSGATAFQKSVWRELLKLAPGVTRSYGQIAAAIGRPRAVRAVGGACGANPIPVLVPCHRVLAANQKLGGFSAGLAWKRKLLAREGVNGLSAE